MKSFKRAQRPVSGVLLLDKPTGITSHRAVQMLKNLFRAKKAGHTGSLDPIATGLLPICLGEATKFSQYLLNADKAYRVKAKLGICTDTGDAAGVITARNPLPSCSEEALHQALFSFLGVIKQVPPMYSAIKYQGKPLYHFARQGQVIDRAPREVNIFKLDLLNYHRGMAELLIHCSKGTYIRTLVEDWGKSIGCGAYVLALRRLQVGHYHEEHMISWPTLRTYRDSPDDATLDQYLLNFSTLLHALPVITLKKEDELAFRQGRNVITQMPAGCVQVRSDQNHFIGVGTVNDQGRVLPKRLLAT